MPLRSSASERPALDHGDQNLQGRDDAVAGGGEREADQVAGGLAAELPTPGPHEFQDVAVANGRSLEGDAAGFKRPFQAEVGHHGADHAT